MGRRRVWGFLQITCLIQVQSSTVWPSLPIHPTYTGYGSFYQVWHTFVIIFKSILDLFIHTVGLLLFLKESCHNVVIGVSLLEMIHYFSIVHNALCFAPQSLHKLLLWNTLGRSAYSQEHSATIVYANFGGQTECIMGELENRELEFRQNKNKIISYLKQLIILSFMQLCNFTRWIKL